MKFAKLKGLALSAGLALAIGNVVAVPPGKTVEFDSPRGKVTFDGKAHADKGLKCADCHSKPKLFEMKKGGDKMPMASMNEGKFCGACHDGKKAFSVKAAADCAKCHQAGKEKSAAATPKEEAPGDWAQAKAAVR